MKVQPMNVQRVESVKVVFEIDDGGFCVPKNTCLRCVFNTIWVVCGGFWVALAYWIIGVMLLLPICTIPCALQCFKIGGYVLWPFGKKLIVKDDAEPGCMCCSRFVANVLWAIFLGWELALAHVAVGIVDCCTIIGIPVGIQMFRLAFIALMPFGTKAVSRTRTVEHTYMVVPQV